MASPYLLPPDETELTGACAFEDGLCTWTGQAAHLWRPEAGWTALSDAPTAIDSGFELQSGVLAGADTHVGFLPTGDTEWAGWVDLSDFSDAHPMYGDLLLCTDAETDTYTLFSVSASGLNPISAFKTDELAHPVASWSAPTNPERLLLLGDGGLWALSPPYTGSDLQHLVSFDDVQLPPVEEFPGFFQPGVATVVVPRRTRTALRLDLSDGSGHATGLAHLPGSAALWTAYLNDDRTLAARLLSILSSLPPPSNTPPLRLHDVLLNNQSIQALATSAGLFVPGKDSAEAPSLDNIAMASSPFDASILLTWRLWLDGDDTLEAACRRLCNTAEPSLVLAESLQVFAGPEAIEILFDLLRSEDPPTGPDGEYGFPAAALRALVAAVGDEGAPLVSTALSAPSVPARVAACLAASATHADLDLDDPANKPVLWGDAHPVPEEALLANTRHDHPAVRTAAREACTRLAIEEVPSSQTAP
jgi:hypothetical protein